MPEPAASETPRSSNSVTASTLPLGVIRLIASDRDTNPTSSAFSSWSVLTRSTSVPQSLHHHLAFRILVKAAHPDLAEMVAGHPVCQEELYNPGRDVSINPNENSILTP